MTNIGQLVKIALTAVMAALLSVVPASGAWAMLPDPDPQHAGSASSGAATVVRTTAGAGFADWQVLTIGAVCALVAVAATLLAIRLVQSRTRHPLLAHA